MFKYEMSAGSGSRAPSGTASSNCGLDRKDRQIICTQRCRSAVQECGRSLSPSRPAAPDALGKLGRISLATHDGIGMTAITIRISGAPPAAADHKAFLEFVSPRMRCCLTWTPPVRRFFVRQEREKRRTRRANASGSPFQQALVQQTAAAAMNNQRLDPPDNGIGPLSRTALPEREDEEATAQRQVESATCPGQQLANPGSPASDHFRTCRVGNSTAMITKPCECDRQGRNRADSPLSCSRTAA